MSTRLIPWLAALLLAAVAGPSASAPAEPLVGHRITVAISPDEGTLRATDTLTLPAGVRQIRFALHKGLDPDVIDGDAVLERLGAEGHLDRFRLRVRSDAPVTVAYAGRIRHAMQRVREGMGRSRMQSIGTIDEDGVFLSGYTGWYPVVEDRMLRFTLDVGLPAGWLAVSQGAGPEITETDNGIRIAWREEHPQDEIQLSAAPFTLYRKPTAFGEAQAYLRAPDADLAKRYLDATGHYLERYSRLIGDYPYAKFALVENFWETGYGMPSFTLLGPRVLRLPFILHSSYPHEILHNWWGNGVFVDYAAGNWSEGLTAYLADHLGQELRGRGADYRRDQLKAYADYVRDGKDFPLTEFRGRHGSASQAVGYGKMLMMAHMLRVRVGDEAFRAGLQRFYRDNLFRTADFDDLRAAFEAASGRDLADFFAHWTGRTGAPTLELVSADVEPRAGGGVRVTGRIRQSQAEPPFPMTVPVVVHGEGGAVREVLADIDAGDATFSTELPGAPLRVAVDPRFDSFRRLLPGESPVTLSSLFGSDEGLILLPADAAEPLRRAYRDLAEAWREGHPRWTLAPDDAVEILPDDRPVWLLGWENRFLDRLPGAFAIDAARRVVTLEGGEHRDVSAVLTAEVQGQPLGWVAAAGADAIPGLARKLPHYGKYGYLTFSGGAPDNRLKGQWPVGDSPLMRWLTDERPTLSLPPRPPLVD